VGKREQKLKRETSNDKAKEMRRKREKLSISLRVWGKKKAIKLRT
jgi:hypothetical protein